MRTRYPLARGLPLSLSSFVPRSGESRSHSESGTSATSSPGSCPRMPPPRQTRCGHRLPEATARDTDCHRALKGQHQPVSRKNVYKPQRTQVLKARQTGREGRRRPAGDPAVRTPAGGGGAPKTLTRVTSEEKVINHQRKSELKYETHIEKKKIRKLIAK